MRGLIVLALLATVTADGGGYSYGAGISGSALSGGGLSSGSLSSGGSLSGAEFVSNSQPDYSNVNAEFNKEFFTYSAPEADFEDTRSVGDLAASLKRNLRVLFIRAPENKGLENAALQLAKQSAEQQTAIYVLTKQSDLSSLANRLQSLNHQNSKKPEVHFVKYRTPEDAINAQRTIQQEYDRLGGTSTSHNAGIAPVLDFATKQVEKHQRPFQLDERRTGGISIDSTGGSNVGSAVAQLEASNAYIPPAAAAPSSTYLPVNKA